MAKADTQLERILLGEDQKFDAPFLSALCRLWLASPSLSSLPPNNTCNQWTEGDKIGHERAAEGQMED